jgi:hypothetical protein
MRFCVKVLGTFILTSTGTESVKGEKVVLYIYIVIEKY